MSAWGGKLPIRPIASDQIAGGATMSRSAKLRGLLVVFTASLVMCGCTTDNSHQGHEPQAAVPPIPQMELDEAVTGLRAALRDAVALLRSYKYNQVAGRMADLDARLAEDDMDAVQSALAEATGSMGSLNDQILYGKEADDDRGANARLRAIVARIRTYAEAANAALRPSAHGDRTKG